jgi:hypothetical protein
MARSNFEELEVYKLSERLSDEIFGGRSAVGIASLGTRLGNRSFGAQTVLEPTSPKGQGEIASRIIAAVRTARASLNGTKHWLRRAHGRKLLNPEFVKRVKPIIDELAPRLNAYLRSIGSLSASEERLTTDHGQLTTVSEL